MQCPLIIRCNPDMLLVGETMQQLYEAAGYKTDIPNLLAAKCPLVGILDSVFNEALTGRRLVLAATVVGILVMRSMLVLVLL